MAGAVSRHAQSSVWNLAPIIHPLPQCPPAAVVYQRAGVEVTLSFREKSPHSRRPQKTRNRVAIVGRQARFRNAGDKPTTIKGIKIPNSSQDLNHC
jgi:hypothetical protein